jgi:mRNA interferase HigB
MHIISQKRIVEAKQKFPFAKTALDGWYRLAKANDFQNHAELKAVFGTVDKVGHFFVFDIGENKYRLIAIIHFNRKKIYIRHILTHGEYDENKWKHS